MNIQQRTSIEPSEIKSIHSLVRQLSSGAKLLPADEFSRAIDGNSLVFFTATINGKIVGMLSLVYFSIPTGLRARIEDVVVLNEYRRQGIARKLSYAAIEHYKLSSARTLDLTSNPTRPAANELYKSIGFQVRSTNVYRYNDTT